MNVAALSAAALAAVLALTVTAPAHARDGLTYLEGASRFGDIVTQVEERLAQGEPESASLLGPLCLGYARLKRYSRLFECLDRLERRIALGDAVIRGDYWVATLTQAVPMAAMLRAEAYVDLGRYREAHAIATKALERLPASGGMMSSHWPPLRFRLALLGSAIIAAALDGDRAGAETLLKQLEAVDIPFVGSAMTRSYKENALARGYMVMGRYKEALDNLGEAGGFDKLTRGLADAFNTFTARGDSLVWTVEVPRLIMRAKALLETGATDEARTILDAMLAEPRLADMGELHWLALFERGRIAERDGKPEEAAELYRRAIEVIERQRASITSDANRMGFVGDKQAVYARAIAVAVALERPVDAFDLVERSKSRALVDLLAAKKDFAVKAPDEARARAVLQEFLRADTEAAEAGVDQAGAGSTRRGVSALREQIRVVAPELSTLVTVSSVAPAELRSLIGADEVLVEYFIDANRLYVFLLTRDGIWASAASAAGLRDDVQELRGAVQSPGIGNWKMTARALDKRLLEPVRDRLGTRRLIIVPHGVLHYLPFAVLTDGDGKQLLDRTSLRVLPSASVLKYLRPAAAPGETAALVFGNPDLGNRELDLAFAEDEARAIGALLPGSKVLLRADASKSNFRAMAGAFSRIHFATHGKFNAEAPLESGLYLARGGDRDGTLTVGELYSTRLDVDLVSLSACETGLGKVSSGDDVVGLTRGFLYAGSRSIVASLWSVDDRATGELMRAFYTALRDLPKSQALRKAQLATRERFPHPFFWAAFQLVGRDE